MLIQIAPNIWEHLSRIWYMGIPLPRRMTIIRLEDGKLFLHSPNKLTPTLQKELAGLGEVTYIIAPNKLHHKYAKKYPKVFPEAKIYGALGLEAKRPDLPIAAFLTDVTPSEWSSEVDQKLIDGIPVLNEVAFFHRSSKTMILTDLCFYIGQDSSWITRLVFKWFGIYDKFAPEPHLKTMTLNKEMAKVSIDSLLDWDFERILVCHGHKLVEKPRERFVEIFENYWD